MDQESIKNRLQEKYPSYQIDEGGQWIVLNVPVSDWKQVAAELRNEAEFELDFLFCLTAVDWKTHFSVVFHLRSILHNHELVVKVKIDDRQNPVLETVSDIWRTAEFHEREAYDLFGIRFNYHPDLRRLFLTEDWKGWPLRKDYEDPVNMIKL
ncbi:MAG: NADH-quinone oxidoreductase subunit C [Bacteroidetes bacterium]|nr:MAG: NADH-quinone oxidoreductase subunit C [Bacteroidota bacterium]REK33245.1 MAG: NADH-quinone oxidoreductase subunit C [Bacteroidota bacterium]REK47082.1 MAG: NADH-quinone oxidoreductase subunit C [Bacteroidota bacterium]